MNPEIHDIRIDGTGLVVQCRVFRSQKEMLAGIRKDVIGGIANSTLACCVHATRSTIDRPKVAAIVFFSRTHLDRGTVAHEFVHAASNILERRKKKTKDREEDLATLVGDLTNAFYTKYKL